MHIATAPLSCYAIDAHAPVGSGAHAVVYRARDCTLKQEVAIKVMSPFSGDWQNSGTAKQKNSINKETRVFDELLATGELHPNVVNMITKFKVPGNEAQQAGISMSTEAYKNPVHFFVTEFLSGGTLGDTIRQKQISGDTFEVHEALDVALSVSKGLRFLHAHGIVHRDVKPDNLVYTDERTLKLIDFSLSGVAPQENIEMAFRGNFGTDGFSAPEVLNRHIEGYGPSVDIFSLGCTLHEMLAGKPPIVEFDRFGENAQVSTCLPERLPCRTSAFVDALLAVEPSDRPSASEIFDACSDFACLS